MGFALREAEVSFELRDVIERTTLTRSEEISPLFLWRRSGCSLGVRVDFPLDALARRELRFYARLFFWLQQPRQCPRHCIAVRDPEWSSGLVLVCG